MTKKEERVFQNWVNSYNIDYRTLPLIIHHYIEIGERAVSKITPKVIENYLHKTQKEQEEAEERGSISLITPEFVQYLLSACMGLYQIDAKVRYKIIKENLI